MLTPAIAEKENKDALTAPGLNKPTLGGLPDFKQFDLPQSAPSTSNELVFLANQRTRVKQYIRSFKSPRALMELGDIHLLRGKYGQAKKCYKNAIAADPNLIAAYRKLIPLLIQSNDVDDANNYYRRLLAATNNHPNYEHEYLLFKIAFFGHKADEIKDIEVSLKQLVEHNSDRDDIENTLGLLTLSYKKDKKAAQKIFTSALAKNPKNVHANNNLGLCFLDDKDFSTATKYFKKAVSFDAKYSTGYENLAATYLMQQKPANALKTLLEAKDANLILSEVWEHNIGWLMLKTSDFKAARKWYKAKIEEEPDNNFLFNNLGLCYERLGDIDTAKSYYLQATRMYNKRFEKTKILHDLRALTAYHNLARVANYENDTDELEIVSKQILAMKPDDPRGHYYRGVVRMNKKDYKNAKLQFEKVIQLDENFVAAYINLGFILESIEHDYASAIDLLEKIVSRGADDILAINNLVFAYIKNGDINKGEKLLKNTPKHPSFLATKGLLSFTKGNVNEGNKLYKEAIGLLSARMKNEGEQIWEYEQAVYWLRQNALEKARKHVQAAKALGDKIYVYKDVLALEKELKTKK